MAASSQTVQLTRKDTSAVILMNLREVLIGVSRDCAGNINVSATVNDAPPRTELDRLYEGSAN